jgi:hypothetical protein
MTHGAMTCFVRDFIRSCYTEFLKLQYKSDRKRDGCYKVYSMKRKSLGDEEQLWCLMAVHFVYVFLCI